MSSACRRASPRGTAPGQLADLHLALLLHGVYTTRGA